MPAAFKPRGLLIVGPLAQLVEQLAFNQLVDGSNPSRPTMSLPDFIGMYLVASRIIKSRVCKTL